MLQNRFSELLAIKERDIGRRITHQEVADKTGIARTTIDRYARNDITRFDAPIVLALCDYFQCDVGDFLVIKRAEDTPEIKTPLAVGF